MGREKTIGLIVDRITELELWMPDSEGRIRDRRRWCEEKEKENEGWREELKELKETKKFLEGLCQKL